MQEAHNLNGIVGIVGTSGDGGGGNHLSFRAAVSGRRCQCGHGGLATMSSGSLPRAPRRHGSGVGMRLLGYGRKNTADDRMAAIPGCRAPVPEGRKRYLSDGQAQCEAEKTWRLDLEIGEGVEKGLCRPSKVNNRRLGFVAFRMLRCTRIRQLWRAKAQ